MLVFNSFQAIHGTLAHVYLLVKGASEQGLFFLRMPFATLHLGRKKGRRKKKRQTHQTYLLPAVRSISCKRWRKEKEMVTVQPLPLYLPSPLPVSCQTKRSINKLIMYLFHVFYKHENKNVKISYAWKKSKVVQGFWIKCTHPLYLCMWIHI